MGYIGICDLKGYDFLAIFFRKQGVDLGHVSLKLGVIVFYSSLELGSFLNKLSYLDKTIVNIAFNIGLN